ncbi:MAG: hypothetical protein NC938_04590 [Candidatus Omnitrophica bacterium]|nr:hypothetical protein [Candidatus Omnitrophota bacterium]
MEGRSSGPAREAELNDLKEFVYKVLSRLEEKYRQVICLCDIEEMKYEEAAKILGCTTECIHTRLVRARRALYAMLEKFRKEFEG